MITFPYYRSPDGGDFPIAEVRLSYRMREAIVYPLVDSGASLSLFDEEVARELGIAVPKGQATDLGGVGGRVAGFIHTVTLGIGKIAFKAPVVFSDELDIGVNLLGRRGIFDHFLITFDEKNKQTLFRER